MYLYDFAELLKELISVRYSGDDRRRIEQQTYVFFGDLLDQCEGTVYFIDALYITLSHCSW